MIPSPSTCRVLLAGLMVLCSATAPAAEEPTPGNATADPASDGTGNLAVENRLADAATLFLGTVEIGRVEAGATKQIFGLAAGPATLRAVADTGRTIEQTFVIEPDATQAWILQDGPGQVLVRNHVGETVELLADGRPLGEIQPLAALRIPLPAGPHQLQAHCVLCDHVATHPVVVLGGALTEVVLGPQPGRLLLVNGTSEPLTFHRNGKPLTRVEPGTRAELAGQPLGRHLVEAVTVKGALVKRETLQIVPREEGTATLEVAQTSLLVRIRNDSGETVRVFAELAPEPPEIPSGTEGTARLPGLSGVVKIKGIVTGNRYDKQVSGTPGSEVAIALAPVSMGVTVHNATTRSIQLLLDGSSLAEVPPGETLVRNGVPPGRHRLEARSGEERFDEVAFQLRGGDWFSWPLEEKLGSLLVRNRTPEELEILLDGAGAGKLPPGSNSLLERLPVRTLTATARGLSGRLHALTFSSKAGSKVEWVIEPESGGVLLQGLAGTSATLFADGLEVCRIEPDSPDPRPVPLASGPRILRIVRADGTERIGTVQVVQELYTPFAAAGTDPEIELRNRTPDRLVLTVDGRQAGEVEAGATVELLLSGPGAHTIHATSPDGTGSWRLENVPFKAGARFGWTVGE